MSENGNDNAPTQPLGENLPVEPSTTPNVEVAQAASPVPEAPAPVSAPVGPAYAPAVAPHAAVGRRNAQIAGAAVLALVLAVAVFSAGVAVGGRMSGGGFRGREGVVAQGQGYGDPRGMQQGQQGQQGFGGRGMRGDRDGDDGQRGQWNQQVPQSQQQLPPNHPGAGSSGY
ncbi:MAG: hypothetical protein CVT67_04265 [Actinobacteria bacterium HGW-Actinobacteria-7]|nr:MAG: hypothetical protein CVT67_04265 [Actinobacteria bacterium HGW-Actinobacteria-7]